MEINNLDSLDTLVAGKKLKRFTFNFSALSEQENEQWLKKISLHYFSCGCETGTIFLTGGVISILILTANHYLESSSFNISIPIIVVCIIVLLALSGIGKAVGLILAKWRLRRVVKLMKMQIRRQSVGML